MLVVLFVYGPMYQLEVKTTERERQGKERLGKQGVLTSMHEVGQVEVELLH